MSYRKRVADINRIYDRWARTGLSNREIWRRYIYPVYAISERQLYNILNASADPGNEIPAQIEQWLIFSDYDPTEQRHEQSGAPDTAGHPGGAG